jgi:rhodanese-related sulfurtransferase
MDQAATRSRGQSRLPAPQPSKPQSGRRPAVPCGAVPRPSMAPERSGGGSKRFSTVIFGSETVPNRYRARNCWAHARRACHRDRYAPARGIRGGAPAGRHQSAAERVKRRLRELPREQEFVAYCRGQYCVLSYEAVAELRRRGFKTFRLEDGYPEWKAAGLPIEGPPSSESALAQS